LVLPSTTAETGGEAPSTGAGWLLKPYWLSGLLVACR
jgi:hypothetical protein